MGHIPVLLNEVIEWLRTDPSGTYLDCTLGAGGYARAIAERLTTGRLIAIDRDPYAMAAAQERLADLAGRVLYFQARFSEWQQIWEQVGAMPLDGIVAD